MNQLAYSLLHVLGVLLLTGFTFQAFAAPTPQTRKRTMMLSGIASLIVLVAGFGLLAKLGSGFPGWVVLKLVCWLGLSAMVGSAYRAPSKTGVLTAAAVALLVIALYAVYYRPF